jgi:rhodanese-related sulfurtransferase
MAVSITAFKDAVEASGPLLLDVRTANEYAEGHLEGAINIPLRELAQNLDMIPTDVQVVSYCKSGWRAALSLPVLHVLGVDSARGFSGSCAAWTAANEPVATS